MMKVDGFIALAGLLGLSRRLFKIWRCADWWVRPVELSDAALVYTERLFRAEGPVHVTAKVDKAYRSVSGLVTLVEFKTRKDHRVHFSDVIELSAQRLAVRAETGARVSPFGYVITQSPNGLFRRYWRVRLMSESRVVDLAIRRQQLFEGRAAPHPPKNLGICRHCSFISECWKVKP